MDLQEKLREKCKKRGSAGIKGLGRMFRIYDDDDNNNLNLEEFTKGVHDYGLDFSEDDCKQLFQSFDKDGSGTIDINELFLALQPPMNAPRQKIVEQAFKKMDKTGDGVITSADLKGVYNARCHKKYQNGEWTEEQVFRSFLDAFDCPTEKDGKITKKEFFDYYNGISSSIDNDAYFDLMIRNAWKI